MDHFDQTDLLPATGRCPTNEAAERASPLVTDSSIVQLSISEIIARIKQLDGEGRSKVLAGARLVRELCRRIDAGMMGKGVTWYSWARLAFKASSKSWLFQLHAIAIADDMDAAYEEYRRCNQERQKQHRDKLRKAAEETARSAEYDRARLIEFAKNAAIEDVRWHVKQFAR